MKAIFLSLSLLLVTLTALAQSRPLKLSLFPKQENKNAYLFPGYKKNVPSLIYKAPVKYKELTFTNCFKPDISNIAPIPTLGFHPQGQSIPNPYYNQDLERVDPK